MTAVTAFQALAAGLVTVRASRAAKLAMVVGGWLGGRQVDQAAVAL